MLCTHDKDGVLNFKLNDNIAIVPSIAILLIDSLQIFIMEEILGIAQHYFPIYSGFSLFGQFSAKLFAFPVKFNACYGCCVFKC